MPPVNNKHNARGGLYMYVFLFIFMLYTKYIALYYTHISLQFRSISIFIAIRIDVGKVT